MMHLVEKKGDETDESELKNVEERLASSNLKRVLMKLDSDYLKKQ